VKIAESAPTRIAYVLPTRNRPEALRRTLDLLGTLPRHDAEVIVVDNASDARPDVPGSLANGLPASRIPLKRNAGAAARNAGVMASDPSCQWIVMLDDDSAPAGLGHLDAIMAAGVRTAAIGAEIVLGDDAGRPGTQREAGGLPEVFTGCGVTIRRESFLDAGGYDASFGYYAEEYDLAARLLLAGMSVRLDRRFRVVHRKVAAGREMNIILHRLVRNNGWVIQRYAPARRRVGELARTIERYGHIAGREHAIPGYAAGLRELLPTLRSQVRCPMDRALWDRFTGRAVAQASLERAWIRRGFRTAAVVDEGKNAHIIREALRELDVRETPLGEAEAVIIGTLSPGPLLDAWERRAGDPRLVSPWDELVRMAPSARAADTPRAA
jgi:GT2 family glycosyltransferase